MAQPASYLGPTEDNLASIPVELKQRKQWVLWRGADRIIDDKAGKVKLNKIPIQAGTLTPADSTDPLTWATFAECIAALPVALEEWEIDNSTTYRGGGLGYVFAEDDPYVGIDLDDCVDAVTGVVTPWAQQWLDRFHTYAEITPSTTGVHILTQGTLPPRGRRKGAIEMYSYARFFTMTGWKVETAPATIEPCQSALAALWHELFGAQSEVAAQIQAGTVPTLWEDDVLSRHMLHAQNGSKVRILSEGTWKTDYGSQSEADLAFCILVAFWSRDEAQIDRLFRASGLMRPKWDERRGDRTYGERTIAEALARQTEHYRPAGTQGTPDNPFGIPAHSQNGAPTQTLWQSSSAAVSLQITDLADMLDRTYPTPKWLIKALIPEGLIFFIGSPKSSKTYLGYSLALSLSYEAQRGGLWLGQYPILQDGPVVYVTLEDDEADSRLRILELAPWLKTIARERLLFVHGHEFPRFDQGLVEVIETQIIKRYHPVLIVLDPISYLYSPLKKSGDQFSEVRDMLLPLRWLGRTYHCTIAGVDHRRKKSADDIDIFETQYGSVSKGAIADAMFVIVRDNTEITLHARVRKAADQTLTLGFEFDGLGNAKWTWKGATDGLVGQGQYGDLRQQILNNLSGSVGIPLSIADIMAGMNMPDSRQTRNAIYQVLFRAQKSGEVQKTTRGQYLWTGGN